MEEKLYFAPANYGKGKKKEQIRQKSEPKTEKNHKALKLACLLLFVIIAVIIVIWLLRGRAVTTGEYPANVRNESLSCTSADITYEKTNEANSPDKELRIDMIFTSDDELSSISLKYILRFATNSEARVATLNSQAQFNLGLQALGYNSEKFNNKFTQLDNTLLITLSASSKSSLADIAKSYFLITGTDSEDSPKTLAEFRLNYEKQGFACTSTLDKQ